MLCWLARFQESSIEIHPFFQVFDPDPYSLAGYLDDVTAGLWSELAGSGPIDPYRRNLQRAHLERLEWLMTEEPPAPPAFFGNRITRVDVSQSDIRPLVRHQLREIRGDAERAAQGTSDPVTGPHLSDVVERIDAILEGSQR